jgi:hypothetical protein
MIPLYVNQRLAPIPLSSHPLHKNDDSNNRRNYRANIPLEAGKAMERSG